MFTEEILTENTMKTFIDLNFHCENSCCNNFNKRFHELRKF